VTGESRLTVAGYRPGGFWRMMEIMGLSYGFLLLDPHDHLYRLPVAQFDRMLSAAATARVPRFAGQRVRAVGVHVQLIDRKPTAVVRVSFHLLSFDRTGLLDAQAYTQAESRRAAAALAPALTALSPARTRAAVVDATADFAARGATWTPSKALARLIEAAALGQVPCGRL